MDRVVRSSLSRRWILSLIVALTLCAVAATLLYPSIHDWLSADRSIDFSRVRTGFVSQGDLLRDVSVQGHIVDLPSRGSLLPPEGDRQSHLLNTEYLFRSSRSDSRLQFVGFARFVGAFGSTV